MSRKEEITALIERIKNGERGLMPELWEKLERLVAWQASIIITKLSPAAGVTFEDLYNSGYIALCDAVQRYEPNTGEFVSLFMLCLKTAFVQASGARTRTAMKDPLRQFDTDSLNALLPGSDKTTLEDTIPDVRDDFEKAEERIYQQQLHDELERVLNSIPSEEAETVRRRYYDDLSIKATADAMNIEPAKARQLEGYALRHLRAPKLSRSLRQFIEETTPYYLHVGSHRFMSTGTSAVEEIVLRREQLTEQYADALLK